MTSHSDERPRVEHAADRSPGAVANSYVAYGTTSRTELVSAAAEGNPEAWAEIVHRFTNLIWGIARSHRLNHDDAADVVQNTLLRLLENLRRIDQPEALPGWLATTARREALNVLRRHTRDLPVEDQELHALGADAPEMDVGLLTAERDAHLWRCFRQLPHRDQQLLQLLVACDRPSYMTIALGLDMPVGSIGPTRMRALKRLHTLLETSNYVFRDAAASSPP
jgi:RNA polymerase sigma factor (sigma-70 family)